VSDQMQGGMAEAMRLMQGGDLTEATAVIQRTLGVVPSGADSPQGLRRIPPTVSASR
jgi:hypothetical protein